MNNYLKTLRALISEIRYSSSNKKLKESTLLTYILNQYRRNITTDKQFCRAHEETNYLAQTYCNYLQSTRQHAILWEHFHKKERTVEKTANMLGFKLPHDPK